MNIVSRLRLKLVDLASGLNIDAVLRSLKIDQYRDVDAQNEMRHQQLQHLFAAAQKSSAYFAAYESYDALPELTKNIMLDNPALFKSSAYKGKIFTKATSGSTGTPFVYITSAHAQSYLWAGLLFSWEMTGYQFGEKVAFIAGNALIKRSYKHKIFYNLMNIELYPVATLTDEVIAQYLGKIIHNKTRLIYGYAMSINLLADYIIRHQLAPLENLRGIITTSEMLTGNMRENIEKAFGVKVFNQYGVNEAGISAFECEQHQMHLISSRTIYELNDKGILLGTDLANEAAFFIKYSSGDLVEFSDSKCSCGRTFPIIKSLIGRSDDIITDRNNKKINFTFFDHLFRKDKSIRQFQVTFDEQSLKVNLAVNELFTDANRLQYLERIKGAVDFEQYEIVTNQPFFVKSNQKHSFMVNRTAKK